MRIGSSRVRVSMPPGKRWVTMAVRSAMPKVARIIQNAAMSKVGTYQPGWPPLSPATLRKKRATIRRLTKTRGKMRRTPFTAGTGDNPLLDTGKMLRGIKGKSDMMRAILSAPFPAEIHEQDDEMTYVEADHARTPPRRAFLYESVEESMPKIIEAIEDAVGLIL